MQLKAQLESKEVNVKSGDKNGKRWEIREQPCLLTFPNGEVRRMAFQLEANESPLEPGLYTPKDSAFYAERFAPAISMRARHWEAQRPAGVKA